MNIKVTPHTISIEINTDINAGEYNITPCNFEFSNEYEGLTKEAIFSTCNGAVKKAILSNTCSIPYEVLENQGNVLLGVYAYETEDDELVLRYSPKPQYFNVKNGSFREGNDPELPTPTEWEQVLEQINEAITETNNLNVTLEKVGHIATITLTDKDGETHSVEIEDGKSLEFNWEGTSLGIRQEGQSEYEYVNLKGDTGEPGAISFEVVQTLPTENIKEGTIYLVPITPDTQGNNYAEYIYVNNQWELLGKIGVQVDLTNYVQFTDYATPQKDGLIKAYDTYATGISSGMQGGLYPKVRNYADYQSGGVNQFIGKGTLENVITGKGLVSNTDYATSSTGGVILAEKNGFLLNNGSPNAGVYNYTTYQAWSNGLFISKGTLENVLTERIGNIQTLLDTLNNGNGV